VDLEVQGCNVVIRPILPMDFERRPVTKSLQAVTGRYIFRSYFLMPVACHDVNATLDSAALCSSAR
jgi:hypothetical protein